MEPIYLDYNATTPLDREVADEMKPFINDWFGNPSSTHPYGIAARQAVETARARLARLLNCDPDEIIFTSGGTESNNLAIKGAALANRHRGNHIITSEIEHPSVSEVCTYLERNGFRVTRVGVDSNGRVDPLEVERATDSSTILITIMHSNNETGALQPVEQIGKMASAKGILFHTDASQSVGKIPVDVREIRADLLSVAGHKFYAPKGVGALFLRHGVAVEKLIHGANHEQNLRAGTENVIEIAGLGKAAEVAFAGLEGFIRHNLELRKRLLEGLRNQIPGLVLNGHPQHTLPNTLSLSFPGVDALTMLAGMKEIAASAGAACHSDQVTASAVLQAMKIPPALAIGTIRFSIGRPTTEEEIDRAIGVISQTYRRLAGQGETRVAGQGTGLAEVRLTEFTRSLGCACKIRPQLLERILGGLPRTVHPDLLVGYETSDDAAVYRISEDLAIVQTVDFIPPIVDDPKSYGMIAAANALSDIYAMGATPLFALSIVGFPDTVLPPEVLQSILEGASEKTEEAGIFIAGGHSIEDNEPKFGLVVTGQVNPLRILRNRGALAGDSLILTKPVGTGIITTALKRGYAHSEDGAEAIRVMSELNRQASLCMEGFRIHACTDVTGFGLLGHLKEMIGGTETDAEIILNAVPVMDNAREFASAGMVPGGTLNNLEYSSSLVSWETGIPESGKQLLADAQTSGGLLMALPAEQADEYLEQLRARTTTSCAIIGKILKGSGRIRVLR